MVSHPDSQRIKGLKARFLEIAPRRKGEHNWTQPTVHSSLPDIIKLYTQLCHGVLGGLQALRTCKRHRICAKMRLHSEARTQSESLCRKIPPGVLWVLYYLFYKSLALTGSATQPRA